MNDYALSIKDIEKAVKPVAEEMKAKKVFLVEQSFYPTNPIKHNIHLYIVGDGKERPVEEAVRYKKSIENNLSKICTVGDVRVEELVLYNKKLLQETHNEDEVEIDYRKKILLYEEVVTSI